MNTGALTLLITNPWTIVAASFLVVTITHGTGFSFGVFLNPFRESFGATSAAVSGVYSIMLWVFAFSGIAAGWAVDRYGPRVTIMAGAVILCCGLLLTSFTDALWQLYLTCGLIGIGLSSSYVPTMTTISRSFTVRRGLALGINSAGVGFGPLIMAPLATRFILAGGWRFAYRAVACIAGLIIPIALLLKRPPEDSGEPTLIGAHSQMGATQAKMEKGVSSPRVGKK